MKAAVIGDPVSHSLSPRLFALYAALLRARLDYEALRVPAEELAPAFARLKQAGYVGLSVTRPLKEAVCALLDWKDAAVRACGAANCVAFSGGAAHGHNTDGPGLLDALALEAFEPRGKDALVLGAGGAARAAAHALRSSGAEVTVCARRPEAAGALAAELGVRAGPPRPADLLVNCTPLGWEEGDPSPIEAPRCAVAVDLVYGRDTEFLRRARAAGAKTQDGRAMLAAQAARAWELWLGPVGGPGRAELVRRALEEASWG